MFGMGFTEILFIAVVAIIFLGPDKLPEAMIQIAKFFNNLKKTVNEAKSTFEQEVNINQLKEEALSYKRTIEDDISGFKNAAGDPLRQLNESLTEIDDEIRSVDYKRGKNIAEGLERDKQASIKPQETKVKEKKAKKKAKKPKAEKKDIATKEKDSSEDNA